MGDFSLVLYNRLIDKISVNDLYNLKNIFLRTNDSTEIYLFAR